MNDKPVSKVLVLDNSAVHAQRIKQFCDDNNLVALKVRKGSVMSVLRTNVDLGGILYSETYGDSPQESARIALEIHAARPELPIIIRREGRASLAGLPLDAQRAFCGAYAGDDMEALRGVIGDYIFCLQYPNALLRGIAEITVAVLTRQFQTLTVTQETPSIVHDRVIFGELLSLIQLESSWCRGYMMLQTEEAPFIELIGRQAMPGVATTFRVVNDLLSETTNLIWGAFKNRYIGDSGASPANKVQVPLVVNHKHKYISFGTENPQLCFQYTLHDESTGRSSNLYERFIFNLNWSPDDFKELDLNGAELVAGELELF
jgi:hypothetical protein